MSATYSGNWVATVQAADEDGNGDISLTTELRRLPRTSGTATSPQRSPAGYADRQYCREHVLGDRGEATGGGLDASADFEGSFSGGFYGAKGAEAGGVFDFASDDDEGGAFRGAFGGKRD